MGRVLAWIAGLAALAAIAGMAWVYGVSEYHLRRPRSAPFETVTVPTDSASIAEGRRLAAILGCLEGCHGKHGQGLTFPESGFGLVHAPNLSVAGPTYSDAELVRVIRHGVKRNGRSATDMPTGTFNPLSDVDLGRVMAFVRNLPKLDGPPIGPQITWTGRLRLATGRIMVSADEAKHSPTRWGTRPRVAPFERGRYLASITCTECHGLDLNGEAIEGSPPLGVVQAYTEPQFKHLMRTGVPISGRDLGMMSETARVAFSLFTDQEISDLYTYLAQRAKGDTLDARAP